MEAQEKALIERLVLENPELASLVSEHKTLKAQLQEMNSRPYLSPEEDLERKKMQKAKLAAKDRIQNIMDQHRG